MIFVPHHPIEYMILSDEKYIYNLSKKRKIEYKIKGFERKEIKIQKDVNELAKNS